MSKSCVLQNKFEYDYVDQCIQKLLKWNYIFPRLTSLKMPLPNVYQG